jgi:hypothetical protein
MRGFDQAAASHVAYRLLCRAFGLGGSHAYKLLALISRYEAIEHLVDLIP